MGELIKPQTVFQDPWFGCGNNMKKKDDQWATNGGLIDSYKQVHGKRTSSSSSSSIGEDSSTISNGSTSSLDTTDDASSSESSNSNGALYDLSEIMEQLPIKRGLSRFYNGKSESFTSLARVTSVEDLAKKETPYTRKMKSSRSYAAGLNSYKPYIFLKPAISKKASEPTLFSSKRVSLIGSRSQPTLLKNIEC